MTYNPDNEAGIPFKKMAFPLTGTMRRVAAKSDMCPECGGQLDTGWECHDCGFDAQQLTVGDEP